MSFAQMDASCRMTLINAKVDRAKQNLIDMELAFDKFCGYSHRPKRKVQSLDRPYGGIPTYEVPLGVLTAAGDVIGNLIGAFDHLAFQLIMARTPNTPEGTLRSAYFPLADHETGFKSRLRTIKKLIHPDAVELIKAIKPYSGGNEALALLHKLNNLSKHRLILNVAEIVVVYGDRGAADKFLYKPGDVYFLGTWGRPQVNDYILPTGIETIHEIRAGQPEAIFPALHHLVAVVDGIVQNFLPYL